MAGTNKFYQPVQGAYVNQYAPDIIDKDLALQVASNTQNKYDTALAAANQDFIDVQYLNRGDMGEIAQQKMDEYSGRLDQTVDDLTSSKDFTTASREILALRRDYSQDQDIKQLKKVHDGYKEHVGAIRTGTKSGAMQTAYLNKAHETYDNFSMKDQATGQYSQMPDVFTGDLTPMADLLTKVQAMVPTLKGSMVNDNGQKLEISEINYDDNGKMIALGYNQNTQEYEEVSGEAISTLFQEIMENDPYFKAEGANWDHLYGKDTFKNATNAMALTGKSLGYLNTTSTNKQIAGPVVDETAANKAAEEAAFDQTMFLQNKTTDGFNGSKNSTDPSVKRTALKAKQATLSTTNFGEQGYINAKKLLGENHPIMPEITATSDGKLSTVFDKTKFTLVELNKLKVEQPEAYQDAVFYNSQVDTYNSEAFIHNENNDYYRKAEETIFTGNGMPIETYGLYREAMDIMSTNPQGAYELFKTASEDPTNQFQIGNLKPDDFSRLANGQVIDELNIIPFSSEDYTGELYGFVLKNSDKFKVSQDNFLNSTNLDKKQALNAFRNIEVLFGEHPYKTNDKKLVPENASTIEDILKMSTIPEKMQDGFRQLYSDPQFQAELKSQREKVNTQYVLGEMGNQEMTTNMSELEKKLQNELGQKAINHMPVVSYSERAGKTNILGTKGTAALVARGVDLGFNDDYFIKEFQDNPMAMLRNADIILNNLTGNDVTNTTFTDDGPNTSVYADGEDAVGEGDEASIKDRPHKYNFRGTTYSPELGRAGFVVVKKEYDADGKLGEKELFVAHPLADEQYAEHLAFQSTGRVTLAEKVETELENISKLIGLSEKNNIQNYPVGTARVKIGEKEGETKEVSLKINIRQNPENPLVYSAESYYTDDNGDKQYLMRNSSLSFGDIALNLANLR
jgi:hypothetical protein